MSPYESHGRPVQFRLYTVSVHFSECHELPGGLRRPSPLACAVSHAAAFAVNVALMVSPWQHCERSFPLHPPTNTEHETGKAASSDLFQVFGMTRSGIEPKTTSFGGTCSTNCQASPFRTRVHLGTMMSKGYSSFSKLQNSRSATPLSYLT